MAGQDEIRRLMKEAKQKPSGGTGSSSTSRLDKATPTAKTAPKAAANPPQKPALPADFFDDSTAHASASKTDAKQQDADWEAFTKFADEVEQQTSKEEGQEAEEEKEREAEEKLENMQYLDRYRHLLERATALRNGKRKPADPADDTIGEEVKAIKAAAKRKKQKKPKQQ